MPFNTLEQMNAAIAAQVAARQTQVTEANAARIALEAKLASGKTLTKGEGASLAAFDPRDPALNYVVVRGIRSPGRAQLTSVTRPFQYDVQTGYGMSGARTIYRGQGIARPLLTVSLWTPEHHARWAFFAAGLKPPTATQPFVVKMGHPMLTAVGISAVAVEEISAPERQSNGIWLVTVKLLEWRPPLPAIVKPRGAVPSVDQLKRVVPPKTEAEIALNAEWERFNRL